MLKLNPVSGWGGTSADWAIEGGLPKQVAHWLRYEWSEEANHDKILGYTFQTEESVRKVRCEGKKVQKNNDGIYFGLSNQSVAFTDMGKTQHMQVGVWVQQGNRGS